MHEFHQVVLREHSPLQIHSRLQQIRIRREPCGTQKEFRHHEQEAPRGSIPEVQGRVWPPFKDQRNKRHSGWDQAVVGQNAEASPVQNQWFKKETEMLQNSPPETSEGAVNTVPRPSGA